MFEKTKIKAFQFFAKVKSKRIYPENIETDFTTLLSQENLKIAIIDDEEFIYKDALEAKGFSVTQFYSYITPQKSKKSPLKVQNLSKFDIILCDIHDIAKDIYQGSDGVSAINDIREKHPLHVIAAYTGDPGALHKKNQPQTVLDKVFSRDWDIDDFLLNFQELVAIYKNPKKRWQFLKKRLEHLEVSETKIEQVRRVFSENLILSQLLHEKMKWSAIDAYSYAIESESRIDIGALSNHGITAVKITSLLRPLFTGVT
ncbi:MAG: hypothetical protein ACN6P1_05005 [Pseudomonas sp.]|uniref:hypothetical protein n=1 Tax=Pseudomonas sp. TaxID=306 RepID=UPI003D12E931